MILYGGIMIKERLKKLIAKGILTPQQASQYLRESSHIPLRSWLIDHRYLNEARWKQIFPKEDVALPNSFVLEPQNNTNAPTQANLSIEQQTREQINVGQQNQFRHYKMDKKLGEGGMGKVYKAIDTITNRVVALKFISSQVITQQDHKRFFQEVRAISRLTHDNIIQLYEVGEEPTLYYAMEYIEGKTLKDVHKLSYKQTANILREVAEALHYAHSKNIVHRDIKPDNIILTEKYRAKLTDFGLAKDTEIQNSISRTGSIVGTPAYLSPEQVQGAKVTPQSDVYSVGATLYYVLTGQPPFRDESFVSLFFDILHTIPPAPRRIKSDIPKSLENICLKCLEKKPEHRYTTAQQLADDLQNYIDDKPVAAGKSTWRTFTHYMHKLTMRKGLLFLLFCNAFLFALTVSSTVFAGGDLDLDSTVKTVDSSQRSMPSDATFSKYLIAFSKQKQNEYLWSAYDRGMLLYQMREKKRDYEQEARQIWMKGSKDKNYHKAIKSMYQLFHVDMIKVISTTSWKKFHIKKLLRTCDKNITRFTNISNKSPTDIRMLRNCLQFQDILKIIIFFLNEKKNIKNHRKFFDAQKLYGGYQNLFRALQCTQRLSNQIKFLHVALREIPEEELVYSELLKVYNELGFYEEAKALYDHLVQNINPHVLNAKAQMLSMFMSQGKMDKAKKIIDEITDYERRNNNWLQLLYCQYLFLIDDNDTARTVLGKLPILEEVQENNIRATIERALDEQPSGHLNILIEAAKLYILKNNIDLAKKYIAYVEERIKEKTSEATNRTHANLRRTKLYLYHYELQNKPQAFSFHRFRSIVNFEKTGGSREQFISLLCIIRFLIQHNVDLDEYWEFLKRRCDSHTFFRLYGEQLFQNKKYLDAIGYWENAIHLQPIFNDYLAKKQLQAWELLNAE